MRCVHLEEDGRCSGMYKGFACIGARCRAEQEPPCPHYDKGFYCTKYRRFGCVGMSKCNVPVVAEIGSATEPRARA